MNPDQWDFRVCIKKTLQVDDMELMSRDEDIKKNFLDHNIKKLLKSEWDIDCGRPFKHVFRWEPF